MKEFLHRYAYLIGASLFLLAIGFYFFSQPKESAPVVSQDFHPPAKIISQKIGDLETVGFADPLSAQKSAFKEALTLFQEGKYVDTEKALLEFLNKYPEHSEANYYLGLSYLYQEKKLPARKILIELSHLPEFQYKQDAEWFALLASIDNYKSESIAQLQKIAASNSSKYQQAAATILASIQINSDQFSFQKTNTDINGNPQFALVFKDHKKWWNEPPVRMSLLFLLPIGGLSLIFWKQRVKEINKAIIDEEVLARTAKITAEKKAIEKEHKLSEELLSNIFPAETAAELKKHGHANTRRHENATVLFCDFKGFTSISEKMPPEELVKYLGIIFEEFDRIIEKRNLEKIKTVGDCYICAGGLKNLDDNQAKSTVEAAQEMILFLEKFNQKQTTNKKPPFEGRIGINSGPVVAGIVGIKKFAYDIWGDTVNIAARMEQASETGKINISGSTYELIKTFFDFEYRGKIDAKGKGAIDMYFLKNEK